MVLVELEIDNQEQVKVLSENIIHQVLKCCTHIAQPEGHHQVFKVTKAC